MTLDEFRERCRAFLLEHGAPHRRRWENQGMIERAFWREAGAAGLLAPNVSRELGGAGLERYRYAAIIAEELVRAGVTAPGFVAHNDVAASFIDARGNEEQRRRWLPGLASGELIAAIAITEPTGGSDLAGLRTMARREGDRYLINGQKAYITNGSQADLIVVACRTSEAAGTRGLGLLVVPGDAHGLHRGEQLPTLGWRASDTCNLTFDDCSVPAENLLGSEQAGSMLLMSGMPRERLSIAVVAIASAEIALTRAVARVRERHVFGGPLGSLQDVRFRLATLDTEVTIGRTFVEQCIDRLDAARLGLADAAKAKWWCSELQMRAADTCLQLHGAQGYLAGSDVSTDWVNARVQSIYGGTTEVMKELIGRSLGL